MVREGRDVLSAPLPHPQFLSRRLDSDDNLLTHAYIIPLADLHEGDPLCQRNHFLGYRQWILDTPNAFVIVNGDIGNYAIQGSVSDVTAERLTPDEQIDKAVELFWPLRDRILCWGDGNHERRLYKTAGVRVGHRACRELGIEHLFAPDSCIIVTTLGRGRNGKPVSYSGYVLHGWAGGRKMGGKLNTVDELRLVVSNADYYCIAHTHDKITAMKGIYYVDERHGKVEHKKQVLMTTGSFLAYGGYAAQRGYAPTSLGAPRIRLDGTRRDVHVSM